MQSHFSTPNAALENIPTQCSYKCEGQREDLVSYYICVLTKTAFRPNTLWLQIWSSLIKLLKEESDSPFGNVHVCDAANTCWYDIKHPLIWKAITHSLREAEDLNDQRWASTTSMFKSLTHNPQQKKDKCDCIDR